MKADVWCVPLGTDLALIYAPFHGISTLVNRSLAGIISRCLRDADEPVPEVAPWIGDLRRPGSRPERHRGTPDPLFLGLIPTRGCMMQCAYCDFVTLRGHPLMTFETIRRAADGYAEILRGKENAVWEMHFFGGEPFAAYKEIVFAVNYARRKAAELGIPTHFEVTTNGFYPEERCRWIAENIDTVVLSLDGFPETQDRHRPGPNGTASFPTVCRSADIFSRGSCELIIRSCVSAENTEKLPEWAVFLSRRWAPEAVCLEPMIASDLAGKNGLVPPDAELFARNWAAAHRVLQKEKIRLVYSSGEISTVRNSLCPMGRDALIVSPDGRIGGCWQLAENQLAGGIDLHFGNVSSEGLDIDAGLLEQQRELSENNRERCRGCFCYAHCAGGCVLNRERNRDFCRMTRILTLWQLLEQLDYGICADDLISDPEFTDRLAAKEDFSCEDPDFSDAADVQTGSGDVPAADSDADFSSLELPSLPEDPVRGWVRDGSRIILGDMGGDFVKVLDGDEALRFQLEHAGMNKTEVSAVWDALHQEAD
ncbi:MAG: radical SAM protein [Flexilinea sp.]|nr:radical SAM protein [Flexilinea sp.]